jgi:hypothetical protein
LATPNPQNRAQSRSSSGIGPQLGRKLRPRERPSKTVGPRKRSRGFESPLSASEPVSEWGYAARGVMACVAALRPRPRTTRRAVQCDPGGRNFVLKRVPGKAKNGTFEPGSEGRVFASFGRVRGQFGGKLARRPARALTHLRWLAIIPRSCALRIPIASSSYEVQSSCWTTFRIRRRLAGLRLCAQLKSTGRILRLTSRW